jgi:uncharacterized membrane protein YfcA
MGWGALFMLNSFPVNLIVGIALSFLAGLGVGGGSLLMLWLTVILNTEYNIARTINLLFFIPAAIAASVFRWKQGSLQIKKILPAIICGCFSAAVFAFVSQYINIVLVKKIFGGLLLVTGTREFLYRARNAK